MDDQASQSATEGESTPAERPKRKYVYSGKYKKPVLEQRAEQAEQVKTSKLLQGVVYGRDGLTTAARHAVLHAIFDPFPQDFNTRLLDYTHAKRLARMDYSPTMLAALADATTVAVIKAWLYRWGYALSAR